MSLLALELKPSRQAIRVDPLAQALIFFSVVWGLFAALFETYEATLAAQGSFFATVAGLGLTMGYTAGYLTASKNTKYLTIMAQGAIAFGLITVGQMMAQTGVGLIAGETQPAFAFLAAIAEEVMFRGFLFMFLVRSLRAYGRMGLIAAAGISSMVFTWFHFYAYGFSPVHLLAVFATGIVLALAMWETKLLSVPILAHVILNAIPTGMYGLMAIMMFI